MTTFASIVQIIITHRNRFVMTNSLIKMRDRPSTEEIVLRSSISMQMLNIVMKQFEYIPSSIQTNINYFIIHKYQTAISFYDWRFIECVPSWKVWSDKPEVNAEERALFVAHRRKAATSNLTTTLFLCAHSYHT